ncbi:MAG: LacI family DNA-binding transcriptional regulator [Lachnospiraceae bacterium]|nr:LacI family DNA-binding transcriptional regulator [Lachnospiraceae bacterium]
MATIRDIAEKLGVSVSTVSKGLNGAADISEELRQLILDTAVEMNYTTKRMRKESNKKLCIFVEHAQYEQPNSFAYDIILGFKQAAYRENWEVQIVPITPEFQITEKYDTYMLKNGYSGAFLIGLGLQDEWMQQLTVTNIPAVLFDNYISKNPNVAYVGADSFEGIDAAIEHLAMLHHTRIAFLNGSIYSMIAEHRERAFYLSMKAHDLPIDDRLIVHTSFYGSNVARDLPALLELGATAVLCGNDPIAYEVIHECLKAGYRIPEDISVIGFDDLPDSAKTTPPLTTIRQNRLDLGKCSYSTLCSLLMHVTCSMTLLRPQLVVRESTGEVSSPDK